MYGPEPKGHWTAKLAPAAFQSLSVGETYRVVKAFTDYDRAAHPVGETWRFLGHSFLPYEDGLSLFVSLDGESEWQIRLQWRAETQGEIIDHLALYIERCPAAL